MSKGVEPSFDSVLDLVVEVVMLILLGIPIGSILLVLVLASCLVCLPLFVLMSPFLYLSHRRRRRGTHHPLSDGALGVTEPMTEA